MPLGSSTRLDATPPAACPPRSKSCWSRWPARASGAARIVRRLCPGQQPHRLALLLQPAPASSRCCGGKYTLLRTEMTMEGTSTASATCHRRLSRPHMLLLPDCARDRGDGRPQGRERQTRRARLAASAARPWPWRERRPAAPAWRLFAVISTVYARARADFPFDTARPVSLWSAADDHSPRSLPAAGRGAAAGRHPRAGDPDARRPPRPPAAERRSSPRASSAAPSRSARRASASR